MSRPTASLNGRDLVLEVWADWRADARETLGDIDPVAALLPDPEAGGHIRLLVEWLGSVGVRYETQVHPDVRGFVLQCALTDRRCELVLTGPADFGAGWTIATSLIDVVQRGEQEG